MKVFRLVVTALLVLSLASIPASAQFADDSAWRALAAQLDGGVTVDVRLRDGQHFKATLIAARPDAVLVQRKTRVPVSVEQINYESIASLSPKHEIAPFTTQNRISGSGRGLSHP